MMTAIAQTIADQIGGRAFFMMGTQYSLADGPALVFNLRGSPTCNKVRIELTPADLYDVTFYKVRGLDCKTVASESGCYQDMLHAIIEKHTGLRLSL